MAKSKQMTRRERALEAKKVSERRQRLQIGGITILVLAVLGGLLWFANRPKTVDLHIPEGADGFAWGPADAPVQIQVWSDYNCSHCATFATEAEVQIENKYAGTGQVRLEARNFAFLLPSSTGAAQAALCAADQDLFWPYHDTLFANQGSFSNGNLKQYARNLGLDTGAFNDCLDSGRYNQQVEQERTEGQNQGVSSTPTILVNGVPVAGAQDFSVFDDLIQSELAQAAQ
jgi:protein-disulfide isomerase